MTDGEFKAFLERVVETYCLPAETAAELLRRILEALERPRDGNTVL